VRLALRQEGFAARWAAGQALSWEEIVVLAESALAVGSDAMTRRPVGGKGTGTLTPRQQDVATLVAQGLTNREIAKRLTVTERAAAAHIEHILDRLGVRSRAQIAVWASEHGLLATHPN
jgi:DNA-binding NarL/FixJ family response regulator